MADDGDMPAEILTPVEQDTIAFYGRPLVAVRLADGRICAALRWLCEGMGLDAHAQVRRIRRKAALRDDAVMVRIETDGGPQSMPALALHGLPGWLYTIDETRVSEASRPAVILFQRECTDVLAAHFAQRTPALAPPASLVPEQPITRPDTPASDAPPAAWLAFHRQMIAWLEWQQDIDRWRASIEHRQDGLEDRLESAEAMLQLVPELIERLGPATLTPEHQHTVQAAVKRLHELGGFAYSTVYAELGQAFHVGKYSDIPDAQWPAVADWFRVRIESAERGRQGRGGA